MPVSDYFCQENVYGGESELNSTVLASQHEASPQRVPPP